MSPLRHRRTRSSGRPSLVLAVAALAGVAALAALPARAYLAQVDERSRVRAHLSEISDQNVRLRSRLEVLASATEIERLARERHQLVMPGEEAYAVLPDPATASPTTTSTPIIAAPVPPPSG